MTEKQCPVCGKVFYVEPEFWAYRVDTRSMPYHDRVAVFFCSWTCLRHAKAQGAKKTGGQGAYRRKPIRCVETGEQWDSIAEAMDKLNLKRDQINRALKNGTRLYAPGRDAMHLERA